MKGGAEDVHTSGGRGGGGSAGEIRREAPDVEVGQRRNGAWRRGRSDALARIRLEISASLARPSPPPPPPRWRAAGPTAPKRTATMRGERRGDVLMAASDALATAASQPHQPPMARPSREPADAPAHGTDEPPAAALATALDPSPASCVICTVLCRSATRMSAAAAIPRPATTEGGGSMRGVKRLQVSSIGCGNMRNRAAPHRRLAKGAPAAASVSRQTLRTEIARRSGAARVGWQRATDQRAAQGREGLGVRRHHRCPASQTACHLRRRRDGVQCGISINTFNGQLGQPKRERLDRHRSCSPWCLGRGGSRLAKAEAEAEAERERASGRRWHGP